MSELDKHKVLEYLTRFPRPTCPVCKSSDWKVNHSMFALVTMTAENELDLENVYPCVTLCCAVCAYVMLFNAINSGLHPSNKIENDDNKGIAHG